MGWVLGIDTSCYTTSLALVDTAGRLVAQQRRLLKVKVGERGLRQSEAVFQHNVNLPELAESLVQEAGLAVGEFRDRIIGIAASTRPRPVAGSYMPVFKVAEGFGRSWAALFGVSFIPTSHQEGHLMAGLWSAGGPNSEEFLAVHLSGGTTELLRVRRLEPGNGDAFQERLLGGSRDLHAGQLIDRVGVAMGLEFPAGPRLEELAAQVGEGGISIPSSVKGYEISFSGAETQATRLLAQGADPSGVARAVEKCIINSLEKILRLGVNEEGLDQVLIVGGVAANRYLRSRLKQRLEHPAVGARLYFAEAVHSTDNAVGVALIGAEALKSKDLKEY
ncbi:MAG: O-sialoglycoprotein endopeptidase [Clostridia bacterium]|nr:O-sialoglycoprotein endopeptidase [Clostridia bacterium]